MKIQKLKNGIPVVLVPMAGAKSVTVQLFFRVGSRYEEEQINGASHFVEHLMFKGTKRRPESSVLLKEIEQLGAYYNASTDRHVTEFHMKLDADKTFEAIDFLSDMTMCSTFNNVESERGVIIEEINMYQDDPVSVAYDLLSTAQFKDTPLGRKITGPVETIKNISAKALIDHYSNYYHPKHMTIVLAGKIVPGVMKMLEKAFSVPRTFEPTNGGSKFIPFEEPAANQDLIFEKRESNEQVQLLFGFYAPQLFSKKSLHAKFLAKILGGGMSSRLFLTIREKLGLCYSVYAANMEHEDTGSFVIGSGLDKKRFPEATKAIIEMCKEITTNGITKDELQRAKDNWRGKNMLAFETSDMQAAWYGCQYLLRGKVTTPEERIEQVNKVTVKQVNEIAREILQPKYMTTAIVGPLSSKAEIQKRISW